MLTKKELHIRLDSDDFEYIGREAEKRNISVSEYIRLIVKSHMKDGIEAKEKLLLLSLPAQKRIRLCKQILKKEKRRKGKVEYYVEGILNKNPKASAEVIYKALSNTFSVPVTPNIRKMVRRIKKKFRERARYAEEKK